MARPRPKRPPRPQDEEVHPAVRARMVREILRNWRFTARQYNRKRIDAGMQPLPVDILGKRLT